MMRPRKISDRRFISSRSRPTARTLISISSRSMWAPSVRSTTLTTSTRRFRCLVICSMTASEPLVTMVMRDRVSSSVGATVRVSMLYPRAENRPTTRDSAPGSFSSSTEMMCFMVHSLLFRPEQHFSQAAAGLDHWPYVFSLIGNEIKKHQTVFVLAKGFANGRFHIGGAGNLQADVAVAFGKLDEVRQGVDIGFRIARSVVEFLPLAHHPQITVVETQDFGRQPVLLAGGQFLNVHLDRGFTRDDGDVCVRVGHLHAHGIRQADTHGAQPAGIDPAAGFVETVILGRPHLVLTHI